MGLDIDFKISIPSIFKTFIIAAVIRSHQDMLDKLFWYLERKRIKLHLMNTEQELRNADVSHLDYKLKENRAKMIQSLNQYWKKEEFPKNTTHKVRIPQIKDKDGTPCALAYMIENSGNCKLVSQLAKTRSCQDSTHVPAASRTFSSWLH
ncbi:MAG: hypothetical protein AUF74_02150 [Thaumarchaeota archaeon 13_1_20CM_2_38_5]|nr:MAG: hypothetical protein AUF74_02150 [Thaumarchaeota archaeon 13_1_20CM_2_38_5]